LDTHWSVKFKKREDNSESLFTKFSFATIIAWHQSYKINIKKSQILEENENHH